jgi:N-acetylmuramoyl-L-alanine amidase
MDEEHLRYSDFKLNPGNACDAQNIALAAAVHSALCRHLPIPDRGIKRARFVVIKNIRIPGILLEGGFLSSAYDGRMIATGEYRQRIAQSIFEAVTAYKRAVNGAGGQPSAVVTVPAPAGSGGSPAGSAMSLNPAVSKLDLDDRDQ